MISFIHFLVAGRWSYPIEAILTMSFGGFLFRQSKYSLSNVQFVHTTMLEMRNDICIFLVLIHNSTLQNGTMKKWYNKNGTVKNVTSKNGTLHNTTLKMVRYKTNSVTKRSMWLETVYYQMVELQKGTCSKWYNVTNLYTVNKRYVALQNSALSWWYSIIWIFVC